MPLRAFIGEMIKLCQSWEGDSEYKSILWGRDKESANRALNEE